MLIDGRKLSTVLLLAATLLLSACKEEKASVGAPAPTLAAYDLQGNQVSLTQWKGKYVYLNFWASNCGGCLVEMPTLEKLSQSHRDNIVVVGINTDREEANIQTLLQDRQVTFPNVRDQMAITQERYQVIGTPTSFLIDPEGKLLAQYVGMMNEPQLKAIFDKSKG
ncbi:TlpA family protein disulfide reductase [Pragia fontium]|uniref:Thiol-disulfide isomerase or thioredoxin n=2 Tax=Pragia fontium TaxID=82985 RepID=A0AAJ4WBF3_9GAMM|nr:TlpA disulfide reductase family protein [Pragia fontium]AKJ42151.1 thioredoxin [Pragia fontium]SFC99551.1 Thiol-disulfide isomerase or thioredoxin [Pragia fontium DSM 5563 = ATCC 49100]SUB82405.1 Thiol-disulfide oxidoreductase resA [Pragia fontium]VEJ55307.1 Thiol-disulfide oxidoreductase resA [Pragia fontium]GKX61798.1 thioredoxin [Pragia fontium]